LTIKTANYINPRIDKEKMKKHVKLKITAIIIIFTMVICCICIFQNMENAVIACITQIFLALGAFIWGHVKTDIAYFQQNINQNEET